MPIDVVFKSDHPDYKDVVQVYATKHGYLSIELSNENSPGEFQMIFLNKQNAIKFAKEVRKQISFMEEEPYES